MNCRNCVGQSGGRGRGCPLSRCRLRHAGRSGTRGQPVTAPEHGQPEHGQPQSAREPARRGRPEPDRPAARPVAFLISLGLDMLGFVAQLVALHRLPLFAVQAIVAGNLAVTAVLASRLIDVQLTWRDGWRSVAWRSASGCWAFGRRRGCHRGQRGVQAGADRGRGRGGGGRGGRVQARNWPAPGARRGGRPGLRHRRGGRPGAARISADRTGPRPGRVRAGRGRHRVIHAVRDGAGRGQRHGGDGRGGAGRDRAAGRSA